MCWLVVELPLLKVANLQLSSWPEEAAEVALDTAAAPSSATTAAAAATATATARATGDGKQER